MHLIFADKIDVKCSHPPKKDEVMGALISLMAVILKPWRPIPNHYIVHVKEYTFCQSYFKMIGENNKNKPLTNNNNKKRIQQRNGD